MMESSPQSLREDLYRVINHYADLAKLARKGTVDPISQIGLILQRRLPYLLLIIRDLLPGLERGEITFNEALYTVIRAAQKFPDQEILLQSRDEIERVETEGRAFIYAVKWMDAHDQLRPNEKHQEQMIKILGDLNAKYRKLYAHLDDGRTTIVPCHVAREEGETAEMRLNRTADLVRRALLELHRFLVEHPPPSSFWNFFSQPSDKESEDELMMLANFLIRCGYSVDRMATGFFKERLSAFLNEKLLDNLIAGYEKVRSIQGLSNHLAILSVIDFGGFFELAMDYKDLEDPREIAKHAKIIKKKGRRGSELLLKLSKLHELYASLAQGMVARRFLLYRYQSAYGAYYGTNIQADPRSELAVRIYKPLLDRENMAKRADRELAEASKSLSTKTREEMAAIMQLLSDSLENPKRVRGIKVRILGEISSGAMGKVSLGIFRNRIVALKTVKTETPAAFGDPMALLEYEAAMHARVQEPEQHPYVVDYYGLIEQEGEKLLINSYHPNDSLTHLVEKNWTAKFKPPLETVSSVTLGALEVIITQLLDCLRLFREKGVVHRDLKTDNVLYMVDESERVSRIKVIDFGVAVSRGHSAIDDLFKGKVVGTFSYMAPEQSRGHSVFESDLYSVGAILTVVLTGKLPMVFPRAATREDLAKQILRVETEPRPKVTTLNPRLKKNSALEYIAETVDRMLELSPEDRPSIEDLQEAFGSVFQEMAPQKHSLSVYYENK
jgi:hypothetical protein